MDRLDVTKQMTPIIIRLNELDRMTHLLECGREPFGFISFLNLNL